MNNLNVFILFSTLIYFKLEENKSGNLKIAVGLVALYALYNLFRGSEGFLNDPAPTDNSAGTRFCGTTNMWVAGTTDSEATCTETTPPDGGSSVTEDADACSGVQNLGDSSACTDVIKNSAKACTWAQGTDGGAGTCTLAQGVDPADAACGDVTSLGACNAVIKNSAKACTWTDPEAAGGDGTCDPSGDDPVDAQACGAVDLTDATECNAVIKNSEKACTYTPAVQGFPAHCAKSDGRICGRYTDSRGTLISAPSPGYAPLTDTKCNTIECVDNTNCETNEKCENNICVSNTKECPSSCNYLQDPSPGEPGCGTINNNEDCADDPSNCCSYKSGYLWATIAVMGFILFVGLIFVKETKGISLGVAVSIDAIIAFVLFGGWQWLFD